MNNQLCQLTTRVWEPARVQMNRKPHTLVSKKITEAHNPKQSSKFMRGCGVLHSMLRNLMSLFIKIISLYNPINFFAILYPTSLANLVVEVGTRHCYQILVKWVINHSGDALVLNRQQATPRNNSWDANLIGTCCNNKPIWVKLLFLFAFRKMHLEMMSATWQPFCHGLITWCHCLQSSLTRTTH